MFRGRTEAGDTRAIERIVLCSKHEEQVMRAESVFKYTLWAAKAASQDDSSGSKHLVPFAACNLAIVT
jgi:hypothetical protein